MDEENIKSIRNSLPAVAKKSLSKLDDIEIKKVEAFVARATEIISAKLDELKQFDDIYITKENNTIMIANKEKGSIDLMCSNDEENDYGFSVSLYDHEKPFYTNNPYPNCYDFKMHYYHVLRTHLELATRFLTLRFKAPEKNELGECRDEVRIMMFDKDGKPRVDQKYSFKSRKHQAKHFRIFQKRLKEVFKRLLENKISEKDMNYILQDDQKLPLQTHDTSQQFPIV